MIRNLNVIGIMLALFPTLVAVPAHAANWQKYETCKTNSGEFHLDRATDGPWYQIVIQDRELIHYLIDRGAVAQGDVSFDPPGLVIGTSSTTGSHLQFRGGATFNAGRPGIEIYQNGNAVRISSVLIEGWKSYCNGQITHVDGNAVCNGELITPQETLLDFTVTNCQPN